jgi:hypothetical protein
MIPDTIPCDAEYRDPDTGGVTRCEPRLDYVNEALGYAAYRHQCAYGLEAVHLSDLRDGGEGYRPPFADFLRALSAYRRTMNAMLADAAASVVARDEVVGEIVEEER